MTAPDATAGGPIVVTGGTGQLARAIETLAGGRQVHRIGRPDLDFDRPETVAGALAAHHPRVVVNAAAYTAVDAAETDREAAMRANADGPAAVARFCASAGIPVIQVSTDYVFDGLKGAPYLETDATSPTGVYGASKLAGEHAVRQECSRAIILRTSWVYDSTGKNFVLTMLNAAAKTNRLRVVADQRGCPTAAPALAAAILAIVDRLAHEWDDRYAGIYHAAGRGETTWHGLATATFEAAARHGVTVPTVDAIATADWPTAARRPPDSRLDCGKLARTFGVALPDWRQSLAEVVDHVFLRRQQALSAAAGV